MSGSSFGSAIDMLKELSINLWWEEMVVEIIRHGRAKYFMTSCLSNGMRNVCNHVNMDI